MRRQANDDDDLYTLEDLQFILVDPVIKDGVIRVPIALDRPGQRAYSSRYSVTQHMPLFKLFKYSKVNCI